MVISSVFVKENNYKLGVIDFGIMGTFTREEQNNFYLMFQAVNEKPIDIDSVADNIKDKANMINKFGTKLTNLIYYLMNIDEQVIIFKDTIGTFK